MPRTQLAHRARSICARAALAALLCPLAATSPALAAADALQPPTLRGYYRAARTGSERVKLADEAVIRARAERSGALSAVLPRIVAEDTYFRQNRVDLGGSGGGSAVTTNDRRNEILLRLEQPLFHGLGDRAALRSADATILASEAALLEARRQLFGQVAQAFYLVLGREAEVRTIADSVKVQRERMREIQARNEVGLARRTEVLLADAELVANEAALVGATNARAVAVEELGFLAGEPVAGPLTDDLEVPGLPSEEETLLAARAALRPDLVAARRLVDAARHTIGVARSGLLPSLDLDATYVVDRDGYSTFATQTDWTAQLSLTVPILDGGRARADLRIARSRLREAELLRDELERRILLEARRARLALASSVAQRDQLERAVVSSDESYRLAEEEYRNGLATNLEVISGQSRLLASRLNLERQRYQVKLDWLALEIALGRRPAPEDEP